MLQKIYNSIRENNLMANSIVVLAILLFILIAQF
jgi:hypothetical protein